MRARTFHISLVTSLGPKEKVSKTLSEVQRKVGPLFDDVVNSRPPLPSTLTNFKQNLHLVLFGYLIFESLFE